MLYRNKRTGVVVEVFSEVSGEWEKVEQPSPVPAVEERPAPRRRSTVKKAGK
ncbi:MAG: hypothetical protein IJH05_03520 [Firmicutes bacterium]|nr:hypothetical protein [Bacillota bacterium]